MALSGTFFNSTFYTQQYTDLAAWGDSPLNHYIQHGAAENRTPNEWFNWQDYRATYSDLQSMSALELFDHYEDYGYAEGRIPSTEYASFDEARYLADYSDLATGGITAATALSHYLVYGEGEGRTAYHDDGTEVEENVASSQATLTSARDDAAGTYIDASHTFETSTRVQTLNNNDQITGTGNDARMYFEIVGATTTTPESINNIVRIDIDGNYQTAGATLNCRNADSSLTTLNFQNTAGTVTVNNLNSALTNVSIVNNAFAITATSLDTVLTGTADTLAIMVDGNTAGAMTFGGTSEGYETLNITSQGSTANVFGSLTTEDTTTINVMGTQDLTTGSIEDTVTTINAAVTDNVFTGDLNVDAGGTGAITFTGGTGDDNITFDANEFATSDTVAGGDGTDSITAAWSDLIGITSENSAVTSVETLIATGTLSADTLRTDYIGDSVNRVELQDATGAANIIVRFDAGDNTVSFDNSTVVGAQIFGDLTVEINGGANTDSLTLELDGSDATVAGSIDQNITLGDVNLSEPTDDLEVETLNIVSNDANTGHTIGTITLPGTASGVVDTINISGDADLEIGTVLADAVNASGLTGTAALDMRTSGVAADQIRALDITGSSNGDELLGSTEADQVDAGAGDDIVDAGEGADEVSLGAGVDTYHFDTSDSIVGTVVHGGTVAAADTLTFGLTDNVDVISDFTAGTGGDVIDFSNVAVAGNAVPITGINVAATAFAANTAYFLSGEYNSGTGVFTVDADGDGDDTMLIEGMAGDIGTANDSIVILMGVDSDDLVDDNFAV